MMPSPDTSDWQFVEPVASSPFVTVDDVVGLIMECCDSTSLCTMRLVRRSWSRNSYLCWDQTFALMKDCRRRGERIALHDAILRANHFSFELICDVRSLPPSEAEPIVVQETERLFPITGFRKRRLPGDPPHWLQLTGPYRGEVHDRYAASTGGGTWADAPWAVVVSAATDVDGWQYAVTYTSTFGPRRRPFVRRRQWMRMLTL